LFYFSSSLVAWLYELLAGVATNIGRRLTAARRPPPAAGPNLVNIFGDGDADINPEERVS
jgi:hypothetical protein